MKKCRRCESSLVYDEESPVDCLTWRYCDTCGLFEPLTEELKEKADPVRDRILNGLTLKVSSRFKRWGSR